MTRPDQASILLRKARQDELILERLLDDADVDDETLGFHAQQAPEKLLKALLCSLGIDFPRTHDLSVLLELLDSQAVDLRSERANLERLTPFGTTFRYDEVLTEQSRDRDSWLGWIRSLRERVESRIG
jgi:HEPN domain-containing protein